MPKRALHVSSILPFAHDKLHEVLCGLRHWGCVLESQMKIGPLDRIRSGGISSAYHGRTSWSFRVFAWLTWRSHNIARAPITPNFSVQFQPWELVGVMFRNRFWFTAFHIIATRDVDGWCQSGWWDQPLTVSCAVMWITDVGVKVSYKNALESFGE